MNNDFDIISYIKKNRKYSKTEKIKKDKDELEIIHDTLNSLSNNINQIIFQDKIYTNHLERFLYTDDVFVFILNNYDLIDKIKNIDFSSYRFDKIILLVNEKLDFLK